MIRDPYIEREVRNGALILTGVLFAGFGIEGFLVPGGFIDGGVTGVSMLLGRLTTIPLPVWLPVINLPFLVLGYRQLGGAFALRGGLAIGALAVALVVVPYPHVTEDHVLEAVFGGLFLGAGIGLAVRGSAVLDGTEIAALLISRRSHLLKVGDIILLFNVALFLVAMRTLGVEPALYSILTFLAAARTLDFVIYGLEEFTAVTIFSRESRAIKAGIIGELGRGVSGTARLRRAERRRTGSAVLRGDAPRGRPREGDRAHARPLGVCRLPRPRRRRWRRREAPAAPLTSAASGHKETAPGVA